MLSEEQVRDVVGDLWSLHRDETYQHDRAHGYARGLYGTPDVPEGAGDELKDLAALAVKNICGIVVDAFAQNLAVNGFASPDSAEDEPAWAWWQEQRLDARQQDAHRPALTYGTAFAVLDSNADVRLRTPRQMLAVYADPLVDQWPIYALETWTDYSEGKPKRVARLYDDEHEYVVDLGSTSILVDGDRHSDPPLTTQRVTVHGLLGDPILHGAGVCPAARFVNKRDAEDVVIGEVTPLIRQQRAINAVNFDRLVVSRFGAFPQRYVIGWAAQDSEQLAKVSMQRLLAFEDEEVKPGSFAAASVEPYNSLLQEMLTHVAVEAQVPLSHFTGIANTSAEAIAMTEAPHQRKLREKRESFGETWEQVIRLAAQMRDTSVDDAAEVTWRETEARSYAQVVDGIVKLSTAGVPIESLLTDVPGWSKQRVDSVKAAMRRAGGSALLEQLRAARQPDMTDAEQPPTP